MDNWGGVTLFPHTTVTTMVDNWGGVTSFPYKTVTTMVDNCGGVTSFPCKTVTTMVDNYGYYHGVTSFTCKTVLPLWVTAVVGGQDTIMGTNCDGVWNESVSPSLGE